MTVIQAVVLGIVQGLSEFLPISSSAHLALTSWFFGWEDSGLAFDVALHVGTLVALAWYFRSDWAALIRSGWEIVRDRRIETFDQKRVLFLVVATIPGGVAGLLVSKLAETTFRAPIIMAVNLAVMGVALWIVDLYAPRNRGESAIGMRDAFLIGCAQMLALVPGVSRSGATIIAGRALGLDRVAAARFSFLMSMPIIGAAAVLEAPKVMGEHGFSVALIAGVLSAAVSGWLAISFLLRFVSSNSYGVFAAYRVMIGVVVLYTLVR